MIGTNSAAKATYTVFLVGTLELLLGLLLTGQDVQLTSLKVMLGASVIVVYIAWGVQLHNSIQRSVEFTKKSTVSALLFMIAVMLGKVLTGESGNELVVIAALSAVAPMIQSILELVVFGEDDFGGSFTLHFTLDQKVYWYWQELGIKVYIKDECELPEHMYTALKELRSKGQVMGRQFTFKKMHGKWTWYSD